MKPSKSFIAAISIIVAGAFYLFWPRSICVLTKDSRLQSHLRQIVVACEAYRYEMRTWPTSLHDLTNNSIGIRFIDCGANGYNDPWGNPLLYVPFNTNTRCGLVISWGADGKPGGKKQDRDRVIRFPKSHNKVLDATSL